MKTYRIVLFPLIAAVLCCGCGRGGGHEPAVAAEVTISGLEEGRWVYFSVRDGSTVGSSTFLSESEDAEWAERRDWDFAICGDLLKTNGGTSGKGAGGILRDSGHNFQTLTEAPADGYLTDSPGVVK